VNLTFGLLTKSGVYTSDRSDLCRVNFEVNNLKPFPHLAFPHFATPENTSKQLGFDVELMASFFLHWRGASPITCEIAIFRQLGVSLARWKGGKYESYHCRREGADEPKTPPTLGLSSVTDLADEGANRAQARRNSAGGPEGSLIMSSDNRSKESHLFGGVLRLRERPLERQSIC
jgi:hypothetical protein